MQRANEVIRDYDPREILPVEQPEETESERNVMPARKKQVPAPVTPASSPVDSQVLDMPECSPVPWMLAVGGVLLIHYFIVPVIFNK